MFELSVVNLANGRFDWLFEKLYLIEKELSSYVKALILALESGIHLHFYGRLFSKAFYEILF